MPKLDFKLEKKDKSGVLYKPLFVRYLSLEYWQDLQQIMANEKTDVSGAVRFAIKRALGK